MSLAGKHIQRDLNFIERVFKINWVFIFLICCPASLGFLMLYSAADGNIEPWAKAQMIRFGIGFFLMLGIAILDFRILLKLAYWFYGASIILLISSFRRLRSFS